MERALEFRAWHTPTGQMHENVAFNTGLVYIPMDDCGYQPVPRVECVLMQFSGILDRNGSKIFEGDLLHWTYVDEDQPNDTCEYYEPVVCRFGSFGLSQMWDEDDPVHPFLGYNEVVRNDNFHMDIAGNIFQHAYLISAEEYERLITSGIVTNAESALSLTD